MLHGKKFRQARIERARDRDVDAAGRKPSQQLALLDRRLGTDKGAARERTRLQQLVHDGLDFPPAQRVELAKNKAKKAKEEECQKQATDNTQTDSPKSSKKPGKRPEKS